ncbi:putative ankyrin repeat protein RF_0381 [Cloeon dipterum]|uniref:putative ankyrin repeat protein RF_0381 n=1 Tax=Cloeon dipterum TaxID=197152 RepID=UPI0032205772
MNCFSVRRSSSETKRLIGKNEQREGKLTAIEEEERGWSKVKEDRLKSTTARASVLRALMDDFLNEHSGGGTRLHAAASLADEATCRRLVDEGANVGARCSDFGATVLHYAALNESHGEGLITYFVSVGIGACVTDEDGLEPIHYALRVGNLGIANMLLRLRRGGPGSSCDSLLHFCVRHRLLRAAKMVLERNRWILETKEEMGRTPLHLAAAVADVRICEWLLKEGASVTAMCGVYGGTALHHMAMNSSEGAEKLVDLLLSHGADIEARTLARETPLQVALLQGNLRTAKRLIQLGADCTVRNKNGYNLLQVCLEKNVITSAQFVLENNREQLFEMCGSGGETALHVAARCCDLPTCDWLVRNGADPTAISDDGYGIPPLQMAKLNDKWSIELVDFFEKISNVVQETEV